MPAKRDIPWLWQTCHPMDKQGNVTLMCYPASQTPASPRLWRGCPPHARPRLASWTSPPRACLATRSNAQACTSGTATRRCWTKSGSKEGHLVGGRVGMAGQDLRRGTNGGRSIACLDIVAALLASALSAYIGSATLACSWLAGHVICIALRHWLALVQVGLSLPQGIVCGRWRSA